MFLPFRLLLQNDLLSVLVEEYLLILKKMGKKYHLIKLNVKKMGGNLVAAHKLWMKQMRKKIPHYCLNPSVY